MGFVSTSCQNRVSHSLQKCGRLGVKNRSHRSYQCLDTRRAYGEPQNGQAITVGALDWATRSSTD